MTALVFDLDGTLIDTAPDLAVATNAVLAAEGRQAVSLDLLRHMVGFGARSLILQAFAATGDPAADADMPRFLDLFLAHYRANIAVRSRAFPGVEETLADLRSRGTKLAVLTNKPDGLARLLLSELKLARHFDAIFGAGARPYTKPDPRLFGDVLSALGAQSGIMIGDSVTDVATARNAGAKVILVSYGYTPEPAASLGADGVTEDFAAIPALAAKLGARI